MEDLQHLWRELELVPVECEAALGAVVVLGEVRAHGRRSRGHHELVGGATLSVRVHAGARRDELGELRDGVLVARIAAPAREGRANMSLCRLLAKRLRIAPSRVVIVRGQRSRDKLLRIDGIDQAALEAALAAR
jgi:uncharacterized protein (TIGR00251 family)